MDAHHLIRILRRRWLLIVIAVVFALAGVAAVTLRTTPVYVADARLYVSSTGGGGTEGSLQGDQLAQQRIASYVAVADSPLVAEKVIEELGLPLQPEELAGRITATSTGESLIVDVSVEDTSPERARDVANALGPELDEAVNELENISEARAVPIKVTILRPAQLPTTPISPRPLRDVPLGLALGLVLGLGAAFLREALDTTIHGGELDELTQGAPVLGMIPFDRSARREPLAVARSPLSRYAEAFRQLRTNLQFVELGSHSKVFVITSSIAGEGKSLISCNLALALAQSGSSVCVVESDLRRPRMSAYLDLDRVIGLSNVLTGRISLAEALQTWEDTPLAVLPSGTLPPNPSELLGSEQMQELVTELRSRFDFVLFDTPPLLPVTDAAVLAKLTDGAILVVSPGRTRRHQVERAQTTLQTVGAPLVGTVLNAVSGKQKNDSYYGYAETHRGAASQESLDFPRAAMKPAVGERRGGNRIRH